jgi:ABC-type transport system substrate-binding protein
VRALVPVLAGLAAVLLSACGDDGGDAASPAAGEIPEPGGSLRLAVPGTITTLDPLLADGRAERLASRQVHEPLNSRQAGPFGQTRERPGLARTFESSDGDTIWTATLRPGVRFQDGEPLDADAVLAHVERWLSTTTGRALLPELIVADNPQPGLVRFQLDRPTPDFPTELSAARLGLVAPQALLGAGTAPLAIGAERTGTGPFELREHDGGRTLLARNADWWGTPLGLGPGVDQVELVDVEGGEERVGQLESGSVDVAAALDQDLARVVARNPLLTVVRGGGSALGMERSVRGIESADVEQPLADVWLTDIG